MQKESEADFKENLDALDEFHRVDIKHLNVKMRDLVQMSKCKYLIDLSLINTGITSPECLLISQSTKMQILKTLNLSCNPIGSAGILNLVRNDQKSNYLGALQELTLFNCSVEIQKKKSAVDFASK